MLFMNLFSVGQNDQELSITFLRVNSDQNYFLKGTK